MRFQSAIVLALITLAGFASSAPASAQPLAPALAERQAACPYGHVVTLYYELGTEIRDVTQPDAWRGGPGMGWTIPFEAGVNTAFRFTLTVWDDLNNLAGPPTANYVILAPDGVPGDCFQISVRHAWPIISGGGGTLTTECREFPLGAVAPVF